MNRQGFFQKLQGRMSDADMVSISYAYWFAKAVHRNQTRDCGERYFEHCRRVAYTLMEREDATAPDIIIALLHDCVEDGFIPNGVIKILFGEDVERGVETLSKIVPSFEQDMSVVKKSKKGDTEYFDAIRNAPKGIRRIKLADRLDNLRSMKGAWTRERQQRYITETEKYILPIARATDTELMRRLEKELNSLNES